MNKIAQIVIAKATAFGLSTSKQFIYNKFRKLIEFLMINCLFVLILLNIYIKSTSLNYHLFFIAILSLILFGSMCLNNVSICYFCLIKTICLNSVYGIDGSIIPWRLHMRWIYHFFESNEDILFIILICISSRTDPASHWPNLRQHST